MKQSLAIQLTLLKTVDDELLRHDEIALDLMPRPYLFCFPAVLATVVYVFTPLFLLAHPHMSNCRFCLKGDNPVFSIHAGLLRERRLQIL
ncbi:MAG: hypothetical protein CENE_02796 [Candidatus Celerinatantimonas neptuna]|nr:MAG: hypothetical protein CENE_02796 [Candidatus Celerinatantimonas neptuna]